MTDQELSDLILYHLADASEVQAFLSRWIYPQMQLRKSQQRSAGRYERRKQRENEKLLQQGYIQMPDGTWSRPLPGQTAEDTLRSWQQWQDRKAGKPQEPVMMPPAMAAAWDEFMKNKNRS